MAPDREHTDPEETLTQSQLEQIAELIDGHLDADARADALRLMAESGEAYRVYVESVALMRGTGHDELTGASAGPSEPVTETDLAAAPSEPVTRPDLIPAPSREPADRAYECDRQHAARTQFGFREPRGNHGEISDLDPALMRKCRGGGVHPSRGVGCGGASPGGRSENVT